MRFLPSASVNKNKKRRKKQNENQILTVQIFQQLCVSQPRAKKIVKKNLNKKLELMAS